MKLSTICKSILAANVAWLAFASPSHAADKCDYHPSYTPNILFVQPYEEYNSSHYDISNYYKYCFGAVVNEITLDQLAATDLNDYDLVFDLYGHPWFNVSSDYTKPEDFAIYEDYLNNQGTLFIAAARPDNAWMGGPVIARNEALITWVNELGGELENIVNPPYESCDGSHGVCNIDKYDLALPTNKPGDKLEMPDAGVFPNNGTGEYFISADAKDMAYYQMSESCDPNPEVVCKFVGTGVKFGAKDLSGIDDGALFLLSSHSPIYHDFTMTNNMDPVPLGHFLLQAIKDSDGDLVPDIVEGTLNETNHMLASDHADLDAGGVPDYVEEQLLDTDPTDPSDDDLGGYYKLMSKGDDSDSDGVPDAVEVIEGTDPNNANDYLDTNGDGESDYSELVKGNDANNGTDNNSTGNNGNDNDFIDETDAGSTTPFIIALLALFGFVRVRRNK